MFESLRNRLANATTRENYGLLVWLNVFLFAGAFFILMGLPQNPLNEKAYLTNQQILLRNLASLMAIIAVILAPYFFGRRSEYLSWFNQKVEPNERKEEEK